MNPEPPAFPDRQPPDLHGIQEPRRRIEPRSLRKRLTESAVFLKAFLRAPTTVGAILPSSRHLAQAMIQRANLAGAETVVELGPGTGSFTDVILHHIGPKTTFLTIELEQPHCALLRARFKNLPVYQDSAEHLPKYLERHGARHADYIISGLPWASLPLDVQERMVLAIVASLAPKGVFSTFAYIHARWMPNAIRFKNRLLSHFEHVESSRVVWRNTPPAFVYHCSGAKRPAHCSSA